MSQTLCFETRNRLCDSLTLQRDMNASVELTAQWKLPKLPDEMHAGTCATMAYLFGARKDET